MRTDMGFFCLLLYLTLAFFQPAAFFPELAPYQLPMLTGIAGCVLSLPRVLRLQFPWRAMQLYLLLGFLGAVAMSQIAQGWLGGGVKAVSDMLSVYLGLIVVLLTVNSLARFRWTVIWLVVLILGLVSAGILANHFGIRADLFLMTQRIDDVEAGEVAQLPRIQGLGFLQDPNDLAQAVVAILPYVALAWRQGSRLRNLMFVCAPMLALLYGVYLTHSRGALVAVAFLLVLALRRRVQRFGKFVPLAAGIGLLFAMVAFNASGGRGFSSQEESAAGRIEAWSVGLELIKAYPLFGAGIKNFTDYNEITAHNSFVLCFAETGLLGYFFWMGTLLVTFLELRQLSATEVTSDRADKDLRRWGEATLLSLAGFLSAAFFLSRAYSPTLYLLLALALVLIDMARTDEHTIHAGNLWQIATRTFTIEAASVIGIYLIVRMQRLMG